LKVQLCGIDEGAVDIPDGGVSRRVH
jgi:hypothetical protein